jgi:hypothetical protein
MKADNHTAMVGAPGECSSRKLPFWPLSAVLGFASTLFRFAGMSGVFPNEIRDAIYQRAENS